MKLIQNQSGNHLCMSTVEALKLIRQLSKAIAGANGARPGTGDGFVEPMILDKGAADHRHDAPSALHFFVEKGYK
jgi:hypothetical protein